jgi:hypothetical protein
MLPAIIAQSLISTSLTALPPIIGALAYYAQGAGAATFNIRGSETNSGPLRGKVTVNANGERPLDNEMVLRNKGGSECESSAGDPSCPPPPPPPPPAPPPPAPPPPAPPPPALVPTTPNQVAFASTLIINNPDTTALAFQPSTLSNQTNTTFIDTFANNSGITSLISLATGLNHDNTAQYLAHNSSVLTSMMSGNVSSLKNLTDFLSTLPEKQSSGLLNMTTYQVQNLTNSGQISNSTLSSFLETTSPYFRPDTTALATQPSTLSNQTNTTFIDTFGNNSGITSLISLATGLNHENTTEYLVHNSSVLTSMMSGDKSSSAEAITNLTTFLSTLPEKQSSGLLNMTTYQVQNLTTSGQISNSTSSSFTEAVANFITTKQELNSSATASANSVDSKEDGPDLRYLSLILLIPIAAFITYRTRQREGVIPGGNPNPLPAVGAALAVADQNFVGVA